VESTTQDNISVVQVRLLDNIKNTQQEFRTSDKGWTRLTIYRRCWTYHLD